MTLEVMAIKGYSTLLKVPELELKHQIQFRATLRTPFFVVILIHWRGSNAIPPSAPPSNTSTSLKQFCLGRWLIKWSAGVFHISLRPQEIQPREWEKKNKRTIWAWVSSKCKKCSSVTLHSLCICRLTMACIFREISTRLQEMPTHLNWSSLIADRCRPRTTNSSCLSSSLPLHTISRRLVSSAPLSTAPLRLPSPTDLSGFLFQLLSSSTSGLVGDLKSKPLCLVSGQDRQRDRLLSGPPT